MTYERWSVYKQSDGGFSAVGHIIVEFGGINSKYEFIPFDTRKEAQDFCDTMNDVG